MDRIVAAFSALPTGARVAIAVGVLIQLTVQVVALIDLSRRGSVLGGRKWLWVLVIVAGNLPGAILYLGVGRVAYEPGTGEGAPAGSEHATRRAIDHLYGDRK